MIDDIPRLLVVGRGVALATAALSIAVVSAVPNTADPDIYGRGRVVREIFTVEGSVEARCSPGGTVYGCRPAS